MGKKASSRKILPQCRLVVERSIIDAYFEKVLAGGKGPSPGWRESWDRFPDRNRPG